MNNTSHTPVERTFYEIAVGDAASKEHVITEEMVRMFVEITGDKNPLHVDESYAVTTQHKKRVVHGMLTASLLSELVGMHLPGKYSLILSQQTQFKKPVFIGDTIVVSGIVIQKSEATRTITVSLTMTRDTDVVVQGNVVVLIEDAT